MNKLTPEQRVIKILKDRLPIDMHHYQYQELAEEILTANTEPEDEDEPKRCLITCPFCLTVYEKNSYWLQQEDK